MGGEGVMSRAAQILLLSISLVFGWACGFPGRLTPVVETPTRTNVSIVVTVDVSIATPLPTPMPTPTPTRTPAATSTSTPLPTNTAIPRPTVSPRPTPISFEGQGNVTLNFTLPASGEFIFTSKHAGRNFIVNVQNLPAGISVVVANCLYTCEDQRSAQFAQGDYVLVVTADGPWSIIIEPSSAR